MQIDTLHIEMRNISLYIDLVFCIIVLPLMALIFPVERWFHNFQWYVVSVGVWLLFLYVLNRIITVPLMFKNTRERGIGVMIFLISIFVTYWFATIQLYEPKGGIKPFDYGIVRLLPSIQPYQQAVWSLFVIVETFSFAVGLLTQANIQKAKRRAVEAERDKAEIELYKAQIKPHFMFNTLNSLYGLFLTQDKKALVALEEYISMLRYIHLSSPRDFVPISDEVDYIRQYIGLQALRLNEMTSVHTEIEVENDRLQVPPMLLVTFVENCFKHGVSPVEISDIVIRLIEKGGSLTFSTENRIFPVKRIGEHMGIENCRKRLDLLYSGRHSLNIGNDGDYFYVKLSIELSI